jgi:hypothetical protein
MGGDTSGSDRGGREELGMGLLSAGNSREGLRLL